MGAGAQETGRHSGGNTITARLQHSRKAQGTDEHDVGVGCNDGQVEQVLDLRTVDLLWPGPSEPQHSPRVTTKRYRMRSKVTYDGVVHSVGGNHSQGRMEVL
jgi:hypothetical protein